MSIQVQVKGNRPIHASILLTGMSGSGKTHITGTLLQDGYKVLFIVCNESELDTLVGSMKIDPGKVQYVIIRDFDEIFDVYELLRANKEGYQAFSFDGITEFQQVGKDKLVGGTVAELMSGKRLFADTKRAGRDAIKEWNQILEMMRHVVNPFLHLPMHRIFTALAKADEDYLDPNETVLMPALQGQFAQIISMYFSFIGYTSKQEVGGETKYCLSTRPTKRIETKDRFGLNCTMMDPRLGNVIRSITEEGFVYQPTREEIELGNLLRVLKPRSRKVQLRRE